MYVTGLLGLYESSDKHLVNSQLYTNYKIEFVLTFFQALQSAVQRIETYVKTLEEKVDSKRK